MWKISEATSIALHAAVFLAAHEEESVSRKRIASALDISECHLAKVLQRLAKVGLVRSTRGPRGGFVLGKRSDKITLLDVYEATEGPLKVGCCLRDKPPCGREGCIMGGLLPLMSDQIRQYLSGTTLSALAHLYRQSRDAA